MAKIKELPAMNIIAGFRGNIDFYLWRGIPCARSWPKSPGRLRSVAVSAQWPAFTIAATSWNTISAELQRLYVSQAAGTPLSGRDMFMRAYLSGLYAYPTGV